MKLRVIIALTACRLTRFALRLLGRGATALPGRVALKLYPGILKHLARDVKTIIVTGTNGKTTCCRIIEKALSDAGMSFFANRSGANLIQGITAEFAQHATITGRPLCDCAVIECDEGTSKQVCGYVDPKVVLVTNLFSDQLDRFGDVMKTLDSVGAGIAASPNARVCLNADCSLSVTLAEALGDRAVFFGVETEIYKTRAKETSDAPMCVKCGAEYEYDWHTYGHLGGFRCPACGYSRPRADVAVTAVLSQTPDNTEVSMRLNDTEYDVMINVPGGYNIYNAAAGAAAITALGLSADTAAAAVATFECGFGRMEKYDLEGVSARMILVKNPAGCNQTLNFLRNLDGQTLFVICLNDNIGDGRDVSWIWDVDFELLSDMGGRLERVLCSGIRADELAMRLKYAGLPAEKLAVIQDYDALIAEIAAQRTPVVIMPTYSAMMELRSKLAARLGLRDFWE